MQETVNFKDEVLELEQFFSTVTIPPDPVKLYSWATINDTRYFVENSLMLLKANFDKKWVLPYLKRLKDYRNILTH